MEISQKQINALKYLIFKSEDARDWARKILLALIDASKGLTKPVYFTGNLNEVYMEDMFCTHHSTHLHEVVKLTGSKFKFSHHDGYFSCTGKFKPCNHPKKGNLHTVWLSTEKYDKKAKKLVENK